MAQLPVAPRPPGPSHPSHRPRLTRAPRRLPGADCASRLRVIDGGSGSPGRAQTYLHRQEGTPEDPSAASHASHGCHEPRRVAENAPYLTEIGFRPDYGQPENGHFM